MSEMTNPMNALVQLQMALDEGVVRLHPCDIHRDISVIADKPNGTVRYTYAKVSNGTVQSIALFALIDPIDGIPCFQLGWATLEALQGRGLATDTVANGMDELVNGLKRHGDGKFYFEAVVSESNVPSQAIAKRLLSESPVKCTDVYSGEAALQYLRLVE